MLAKPSPGRPPGASASHGGVPMAPAASGAHRQRVSSSPTRPARCFGVSSQRVTVFLLGLFALAFAAVAATAFEVRTARDPEAVVVPQPDASTLRAVAFIAHEESADVLYLMEPRPDASRVPVAVFPRAFGVQAVGSVAPLGDRAAVLSFTSLGTSRVTLLALPGGERLTIEGNFDFSAPMSWDAWGRRLALARVDEIRQGGRRLATIVEVDAPTGAVRELVDFADVFLAAPVGYDARGTKLYVVTIDPTGSLLWAIELSGTLRQVAVLSAGPTTSWRLSPDRTQLAYVALGGTAGGAMARGRIVTLASGAVTDVPAFANQLGVAWSPKSLLPYFGGPGGNVWVEGLDRTNTYLYPAAWSPDGSRLLALVVPSEGSPSLEVLTANGRVSISDVPAEPLGWAVAAD